MEAATKLIDVDEYFAASVEGDRTQLIDGVVVVNDPALLHQHVQVELIFALREWIGGGTDRGAVFGPVNVVLDDRNSFGPDLSWFSAAQTIDYDAARTTVPDLCVEIRSPSTWRYDVHVKKARYEQHGLPELWLVDTSDRSVMVYRRSHAGAPAFDIALEVAVNAELSSPQLPGFALPVAQLFPR